LAYLWHTQHFVRLCNTEQIIRFDGLDLTHKYKQGRHILINITLIFKLSVFASLFKWKQNIVLVQENKLLDLYYHYFLIFGILHPCGCANDLKGYSTQDLPFWTLGGIKQRLLVRWWSRVKRSMGGGQMKTSNGLFAFARWVAIVVVWLITWQLQLLNCSTAQIMPPDAGRGRRPPNDGRDKQSPHRYRYRFGLEHTHRYRHRQGQLPNVSVATCQNRK